MEVRNNNNSKFSISAVSQTGLRYAEGAAMKLYSKIKLLDSKPLACFFVQSGFGTAFTYLTGGVFLSGLAIFMGAGDVLISYLSVIVNICGILILAFTVFLERFKSRKHLTIVLTILSRLATLLIVVIPVLVPKHMRLAVFIAIVVLAFTLQAQTTVVLNQWMLGFINKNKSGRYISLRQTLNLVITVILSISGGYWMDYTEGQYIGFVLLFSIAALMGILEIILLAATPDSEPYDSGTKGCSPRELIRLPLKNCCFTGFVLYIFAFYLLLNIADSFTMVYLMKYLALPYQTVTGMYMIISLPQVILLGIWGKISDKYGHAFVLKTSIWIFAGETLFMFFAAPQFCYLFVPLAFLAASVGNAGFIVAVFNRRYELMPDENRIVYDNFYTAVIGAGFILGPMIGGAVKNCLERSSTIMNSMSFASIRLLYVISTIGILLLQIIYLSTQRKKENKHVKN